MPTTPGGLGLSPAQFGYAQTIIDTGTKAGASKDDITTALMVALTESSLLNQANSNVPESLAIPNDKVGSDHNSVGLFQQQVGMWGTASELMDPVTASKKFFAALKNAPSGDPWVRAQKVQKSAFPDGSNYQANWGRAQAIQAAIAYGTRVDPITTGVGNFTAGLQKIGALLSDPAFWQRAGLFVLGAFLIGLAVWKVFNVGQAVDSVAKVAAKAAVL
jgi:hypothetical protein